MKLPDCWKRFNADTLLSILPMGLIIYIVGIPLVMLIVSSFKTSLPSEPGPLTLQNYIAVYLDPDTYLVLLNTFTFAIGSLAVGFTTSMLFAWMIERTNVPFRNFMFSMILATMVIPGMLFAIAWVLLLSPRIGLINIMLRSLFGLTGDGPFNIYSMTGMCFVSGLRMVPTTFLMMVAAFKGMDPSLEEASHVSGATRFSTLRGITLPLLRPAILAGMIYYFVTCIEAFEIPGILGTTAGIHVFSTRIYWATHTGSSLPNYGMASTFATTLLIISLCLIYLYRKATKRAERFVTITGKAYRPHTIDIGNWKYLGVGFFVLFFLFAVVLPFFILLWGSLFPFYSIPSLSALKMASFAAYENTWSFPEVDLAFKNTMAMSFITATATILIVSVTSWIVVRTRIPGRQVLDTLTFIPQAFPSIVIGLALVFVYITFPIPIYGTIWIIALALTTRYIAFGSRTVTAALFQIHGELEEASAINGVSRVRTFLKITLPLIAPAIFNGWIWVAVHAARELSAALMLQSPKSVVLATMIWSFWENGRISETCVLGVLLVILFSAITFIGRVLVGRYSRM